MKTQTTKNLEKLLEKHSSMLRCMQRDLKRGKRFEYE